IDTIAADAAIFNPSLTIHGSIQPVILGMPLGSPTAAADVLLNKHGVSFSFEGSLLDMLLQVTPAKSLALLPGSLQAIHDQTTFSASLAFPDNILSAIVTGIDTGSGANLATTLLNDINPFKGWQ